MEQPANDRPWYCIECGKDLEPGHRYCPVCGTERWSPPPPAQAAASGAREAPAPPLVTVRMLPWIYAFGAVLSFVWATVSLASLIAPRGRSQLLDMLSQATPVRSQTSLLATYAVEMVATPVIIGTLHWIAFSGLRRVRRWGWIAAVVVAGLWSLFIVGILFLMHLLRRDVRNAFGFR